MRTIKRKVALMICFGTLFLTLALGAFQVYRSTVDFSMALRLAAERLEKAFRDLQIEESRLRDLEAKKEKLSQIPSVDLFKTMPSDELRDFLISFFGQDIIDVQEISIRCESAEPVVFERFTPSFAVVVRSGVPAASAVAPETSGQVGQGPTGQGEPSTGAVPPQAPAQDGTNQNSGGTAVGNQ